MDRKTMLNHGGYLTWVSSDDECRIGKDAFSGCGQLTILCTEGSAAHQYTVENGIPPFTWYAKCCAGSRVRPNYAWTKRQNML